MNKIYHIFLIIVLFFVVSCKKECSPTCSITYPQDKQEFYENEDIQVAVAANGGGCDIAYVHLYIDNIGYSSTSTAPYKFTIKAGDIPVGTHNLKVVAKNNDGKSCEASVKITVKEAVINPESPNFVTFPDGKLPNGWETNGWNIDQMGGYGGYDDTYSLFAKTPGAKVTATKTCKNIIFYMKGAGIVHFYLDGVLFSEITVVKVGFSGGVQGWKAYYYSFPDGVHSFSWEYVDMLEYYIFHYGVNLDAITFGVSAKK